MKYTLTGDIHAKLNNLDKVFKLFEMLEEIGNPVIILGDLFDTKQILYAPVLNFVNGCLRKSNLHWLIIAGNHDLYTVESDAKDNSLKTLGNLPNVEIIDAPTIHEFIGDFQIEEKVGRVGRLKTIGLIPYIHDSQKLKESLRSISKTPVKNILCHADIQGFKHGAKISESGVEITDFPKDIKIISGHYHSYQTKGNITYLGSPFSHTFSEANEAKYIGILDTETQNLELIETDFPKHKSMEMICGPDSGHTEARLNMLLTYHNKDDIIRVILKGSLEEINMLDRSKFEGIKFINEPNEANVSGKLIVTEVDSNEKQFENWAKEVKKLNKKTIKLGLDILEGVKK